MSRRANGASFVTFVSLVVNPFSWVPAFAGMIGLLVGNYAFAGACSAAWDMLGNGRASG